MKNDIRVRNEEDYLERAELNEHGSSDAGEKVKPVNFPNYSC